eukprot:CAMPEP_0171589422 /NCGR_PEP_ID=MMETSP0961-20121227/14837_1 /TAXON_ID=87120 /ORGANISM="Aurantiochytrium limacinum, Strain ATCCMYA-1381" /LENGTH=1083 /DNA_ID=CAMNT_0012148713 /DNA_START=519 /DNA_END=3770 /DNA_ORIENTATION=+
MNYEAVPMEHTCAMTDFTRNLRELVQKGAALEVKRIFQSSAHVGPESDDKVLFQLDQDGVTLLHIAAEKGDLDMLKILTSIGGMPVNVRDARGGEPILEASAAGRLECIKWLVEEQHVDVNTADDRGDTALHLASGYGHIEVMQWLLDHGAHVDTRTKIDVTPLLYATAKGRTDAVKLLLRCGANPMACDAERGWNAAHTAAGCNQGAMLKFFFNNYPSLFGSRTIQGLTLGEVARQEKCPDSYLAILHLNKESEKEARRIQAEAARKKQADDCRRAKELAQKDFERLERDFRLIEAQTSNEAKKSAKSGSNGAYPNNKTSPFKKSHAKKKRGQLTSPAPSSTNSKGQPASSSSSSSSSKKMQVSTSQNIDTPSSTSANAQHYERKKGQDFRSDNSKISNSKDAQDTAGNVVFVESTQTLGVVGRPTQPASPTGDDDEQFLIAEASWEVKISKREKKMKKKRKEQRSVRSESEDSMSLSTSESGCDESNNSPQKKLDEHINTSVTASIRKPPLPERGSPPKPQAQAQPLSQALTMEQQQQQNEGSKSEKKVAIQIQPQEVSFQPNIATKQEGPQTPRRGPGMPPLSPVKRKNSCESRWTLGHSLKITTNDSDAEDDASESNATTSSCPPGTAMSAGSKDSCESVSITTTTSNGQKKVEFRLRPHAPPWSPRRRKWTSPAANAGQVKAKVLMDDPPEVVENEFQRMLKRFVHMDTGARRTAKRKFAKATADYEEKRLADAEQMETSWRNSIRQRLRNGIPLLKFQVLTDALAEIDAAEEARRMDNEIPHTILSEDKELAKLVEHANSVLSLKEEVPLADFATDWHGGKLLQVPKDEPYDDLDAFAVAFRHSVEAWRMNPDVQRVWIRLGAEELDRASKARDLGFDFDHARPGVLLMSGSVTRPGEVSTHTSNNANALLSTSSRGVLLLVVAQGCAEEDKSVLLLPPNKGAKDENSGSSFPPNTNSFFNHMFELPCQRLYSGENSLHVAEVLAQEVSGLVLSLIPQSLSRDSPSSLTFPFEKTELFIGTVYFENDIEAELGNLGILPEGAQWVALSELAESNNTGNGETTALHPEHQGLLARFFA